MRRGTASTQSAAPLPPGGSGAAANSETRWRARPEVRGAAVILLLAALVLPSAGTTVGTHVSFLPAFLATVFLLDSLSAWLLLQHYRSSGHRSTLTLACAYLWCAVSILGHALTFPDLLAPSGVLGGSPSSATWLWTSWHGGFALLLALTVAPISSLQRHTPPAGRRRELSLAVGATLTVAALWTGLATRFAEYLPEIIVANDYSRLSTTVGPWVIGLSVLAFVLALRHRSEGLERWVALVAAATLGDITLTLLAEARFTLGWYAGRALAFTSAAVVFLALVGQLSSLYRRLTLQAEALQSLADTDELTGLHNRRAALREMAKLGSEGASVAILDLDHFKQVNDSLGHDVGDQVLFAIAGRMRTAVREDAVLGRWGGEEFVVALPSCSEASVVLERLREAVCARPVITTSGAVEMTVSVGWAPVRGNLADSLRAADGALYAAKRTGRNRVESVGVLEAPEPSALDPELR